MPNLIKTYRKPSKKKANTQKKGSKKNVRKGKRGGY